MSKFVEGWDIVLELYDPTAEAYLPIGCLTNNGISESQDVTEGEAHKCSRTIARAQGPYSYEVSADGVILALDDPEYSTKAHIELIREIWKNSREDSETVFWKQSGGNTEMFGEAYITSIDTDAPAEGDATFSISMSGIGEISETDLVTV